MQRTDERSRAPARAFAAGLALALHAALGGGCADEAPDAATGQGGATSASQSSSSASNAVSAGPGGGGSMELPHVFTVTGVVTDGAAPVEGALVMQAGGEPALVTGPDGAFTIELTQDIPGTPTVVAAKVGYRSIGLEFLTLPTEPVEIALRYVTPTDNALGYTFGDPGQGDPITDNTTAYCGHCHTTLTAQFQTSAHARATRDPLVQALYAGTSEAHATQAACAQAGGIWRQGRVPGTAAGAAMRCYLGAGVLPDLNPGCGGPAAPACDDPALPVAQKPSAFGACADCHAAALDGPAGGRDLLDATGLAYENGNHCDACHKARDIDLSAPPGVAGRLILQRPIDKISDDPGAKLLQVMFGPYPDVPNEFMGGSYQPKFSTAEFCAACHEQQQAALLPGAALDPARWPAGLPIHSTFSEWSEGPWNTPGTPCQLCHMPELTTIDSTVDVTNEDNAGITFGFLRKPGTIRAHTFRGPLSGAPRLLDGAVTVSLGATAQGGELVASVFLHNTGAGHAVPTGEPMRALVLVVTADACGAPMTPSSGMTIRDTGGALAEGLVGGDASLNGASLTWPAGAARAKPGDVVRAVHPTGAYDDYKGVGFFADPALTPAEKGLEIHAPAGEAVVLGAAGGVITLSAPLSAQPGDRVYLGDAPAAPLADGAPSASLAGAAGYAFARVLVDPQGARHAPQHRAVDIASDNRIPPQGLATTTHGFAIPPGCASATLQATLLYRPVPAALARERGLPANDYIVAATSQTVPLN